MDDARAPTAYRTIFLSDIHLGAPGCQAEMLLDFLRHVTCEHLYLIGDIVDGWRLKSGWHWPQTHNDVVQKLLRLARKGVRVTYVPGNHDDRVGDFCGVHFGGVVVAREAEHVTADGRRFLVIHGDQHDATVRLARWQAVIGDRGYRLLVALNTLVNRRRRRQGLGYWSLSAFLKNRLGDARRLVGRFELAAAADAGRRGFDGVVCGHIHQAALREIQGVTYVNDGDWVESCSAAVEHFDGQLQILSWANLASWSMIEPARRIEREPAPVTESAIA